MKKVTRKLLAVSLTALAIVSLTGCGMRPASVPAENKVQVSKFENTSGGIQAVCKTLKDKEYVGDDCVEMYSVAIGAEKGYRFDNLKINGSVFSMEIYEFKDTENAQAKAVIDSVKKDESFEMYGRTVKYCHMSDNGKYLLIYPDAKSLSDKGDDVENVTRMKDVLEIINKTKN